MSQKLQKFCRYLLWAFLGQEMTTGQRVSLRVIDPFTPEGKHVK